MEGQTNPSRILKRFLLAPIVIEVFENDRCEPGGPHEPGVLIRLGVSDDGRELKELVTMCDHHAWKLARMLDQAAVMGVVEDDADQDDKVSSP